MEIANSISSFFGVESSKIPGDIFSDSFDFGKFRGTSWWGLSISETSKFFFELFDVGSDGVGVVLSDIMVDFLFHHSQMKYYWFNI